MTSVACPECRRQMPEQIIDEIIERARGYNERNQDMVVSLQCPCGWEFRFAMNTETLEPIDLPGEWHGGRNVN